MSSRSSRLRFTAALLMALSLPAPAQQPAPAVAPAQPEALEKEEIVRVFRQVLGDKKIKAQEIVPSALSGYWEYAYTDKGRGVLLISAAGDVLLTGWVYQRKASTVSELSSAWQRKQLLAEFGPGDFIAFSSPDQAVQPLGVLYVFTDVTCPYCRRMHDKIEDYTRLGLEVRYLPYPRYGKDSSSWDQTERAWCAVNRQAALTDLKKGRTAGRACTTDSALERYLELAKQMGVRATPTIVLQDGRKIEGFVSAELLADLLRAAPVQTQD